MVINHQENQRSGIDYVSVKTQFAPTEIHISIIKLLKHLKNKYILDLEVLDEGCYWETEDNKLLNKKFPFLIKRWIWLKISFHPSL